MEPFPKFQDEYVDRLEISVTSRTFKVFGSDGGQQELNCETTDEFMRVLEVCDQMLEPHMIKYAELALTTDK